jgi:ABC-type amino acid transport substrate-binding protein
MARPKRISSEDSSTQSGFIQVVETYLLRANWTKQQFMTSLKVGEAQFYRWARGENIPTKAIVNRMALLLARRIDEVQQDLPHNPFPASDEADRIVNELLESAGYSASIRGSSLDVNWSEIARDKEWRLGYTKVPKWLEPPVRSGGKPTGLVVKYAEQVGQLLGLDTTWKYLNYDAMPAAIRSREIDGIAPFLLVLPGRFFDFQFSDRCNLDSSKLVALVMPKYTSSLTFFEDFPPKKVSLIYVKGELGAWGANLLSENGSKKLPNEDVDEAVSTLLSLSDSDEDMIPVFLVDVLTGEVIAEKSKKDNPKNPQKWIQVVNVRDMGLETYSAFAFHPDEGKLTRAVNAAIGMIPRIPSLQESLRS